MSLGNGMMGAQLLLIHRLIKITDVLGGSAKTQEDSISSMMISLCRSLSRFACRDEGTKITKMGQSKLYTCPSFVCCHTQCLVVKTVLQIDRVNQCSIPESCTQTGTVEKASYHHTKGAVGPLNLAVIGSCIGPGGFNGIA
jgi:hypothetical protein